MAKRVFSFTDPLPGSIYWDANFIVYLNLRKSEFYEDCLDFYAKLELSQTTSYISTLALDESWFNILQLKIEEDFEDSFWKVYNKNPKVILNYIPQLEEIEKRLRRLPFVRIVSTRATWSRYVLSVMKQYAFLPRDAYHAAAMHHLKVNNIVTLDDDFLAIPEIKIYTCRQAIFDKAR